MRMERVVLVVVVEYDVHSHTADGIAELLDEMVDTEKGQAFPAPCPAFGRFAVRVAPKPPPMPGARRTGRRSTEEERR